jgi:catechol 2,3-dioxygenase-like lactoylglutathione lyase family enzyme
MLDHIGLQVQDVEKSVAFYLNTFAAIGTHEAIRFPAVEAVHHG